MKEDTTTQQWYALYTKSRAEKKVAGELNKLGITNYLPIKRELRQWSDRKKWVEVPAISSYIFICIPKERYNDVFQVNGIVAYVSYKGKAVTIPVITSYSIHYTKLYESAVFTLLMQI